MTANLIASIAPILAVPLAARAEDTDAALNLLELATRLESRISENLRELPGFAHSYVSSGGGATLVCIDVAHISQEGKDDLKGISSHASRHLTETNPFLSDMAARIQYEANMARLVSERNALAYLLRLKSNPSLVLYSALSYAFTDAEKGFVYFFGLHFLPVLRSPETPRLVEKISDVGFGVVAALSLFTERTCFKDLREENGFFNPQARSKVLRTDEGYRIEP